MLAWQLQVCNWLTHCYCVSVIYFFVLCQGDAVSQHLSSAASILMSPMEFQAASSVASVSNSVSARISG